MSTPAPPTSPARPLLPAAPTAEAPPPHWPEGSLPAQARAFAAPLICSENFTSGENMLEHADGVARILADIGSPEDMQAAAYLVYASDQLSRPQEVIGKAFGPEFARLAQEAVRLERAQRLSRVGREELSSPERARQQTENVRKMLLAFSRDLRVVLLRLTSRLQTLRWCAARGRTMAPGLLRESHEVFAPLANRLGIWQIKWEMEDLILRAQEPEVYRQIANQLDERRAEREAAMQERRDSIERELRARGLQAQVSGRPKHIYSILRKMRGKKLDFAQIYDLRALRIIVPTVTDCYTALAWVHERYTPVPGEFDDYIAKPKANGYQSLHTVVRDEDGKAWEVQIRTRQMHEHAENGVAAHWAYKEAGVKGYAGVSAASAYDAKIAVLRQLLAWERDLSGAAAQQQAALFDDRIYVFTPDARLIDLPSGATAVDFAYTVHTDLGHRCRGARVDGAMVALNTPLQNGQTVEIIAAKEGGPSRDWLNPELGYLASSRARTKVRAWFNAQHTRETIARGREMVEKLLQREGKTSLSHEELAASLGFKTPDALFETLGKDELSLRSVENRLVPPETPAAPPPEEQVLLRKPSAGGGKGGVLVVGLDSLLTQMARCCKPAPPDAISGFVTRGRGVSVHRADCPNLRDMAARTPERVIEVNWGDPAAQKNAPAYPVDVAVDAQDRQGLLRDISDIFAREKINVIGVQTQSNKGSAWMTFTVEVTDTLRLSDALRAVRQVPGVRHARRK